MDAESRRPQLPALSYLDIDKVKREEDLYQSRLAGATDTYNSAGDLGQSYPYPSGPPPPYSRPPPSQNTNIWDGVSSAGHTPVDSRSSGGEEYDNVKRLVRQSLPSISEALGADRQASYQQRVPELKTTSYQAAVPQTPTAPSSPSPHSRRAHELESATHQGPFANTTRPYESFRHDSVGPHPYSSLEAKSGLELNAESRHSLHVLTPSSTERFTKPFTPHLPYEHTVHRGNGSMGPPSNPYGYAPHTSSYAQLPPSMSQSSGPIYVPSARFAAPPTPSAGWKNGTASPRFSHADRAPAPTPYGDSVKRHLDLFDLEAALNEIAQSSGILLDFSRRYGDRMHQSARSDVSVNQLPGLVEVDDMISKSRVQLDSLHKIREVTMAQQVAYAQDVAEERQRKIVNDPRPAPAAEQINEDDGADPSSDTKKRRGRAAPPGRCHSCQRAETPEWRRGPDGARTLCNACGLHYAKLTRKQSNANKGNVGSSNLRPKET